MTFDKRATALDRYTTDGMASTSPNKLLLRVFDRLERDLRTAATASITGDIEVAHSALVNAQELVHELRLALDPTIWPPAVELRSLYDYLYRRMVDANVDKDPMLIGHCLEIVSQLGETWAEAERQTRQGSATGGGPVGSRNGS